MFITLAAESELGALFLNAKEGTGFWTNLAELDHSQNATPIQTDNTIALKIANQKIKQRWLQAMDMWFYWIQDRVIQGQFHVYFGPSNDNLINYFTKHHTATHHWWMQPVYLYTTTKELASSILWGYIETPVSIANVGLHSFNSGSHVAASPLSPMTTTRQQWLFLADSKKNN
jgi:hypothetical protein